MCQLSKKEFYVHWESFYKAMKDGTYKIKDIRVKLRLAQEKLQGRLQMCDQRT